VSGGATRRAVVFLGLFGVFALPFGGFGRDEPRRVTCSFSNPAYSGWCKENAAVPEGGSAEGVCRGILSCLNDPACSKTYCSATTVRSGWKLEAVEGGPEKK